MAPRTANEGFVKICGLRDVEHAASAARAGADALGFILAPSRRQVDVSLVVHVRARLAGMTEPPQLVTVLVNESADVLRQIIDLARPDVIQLSGDEDATMLDSIETTTLRAIRVPDGSGFDRVRAVVDPWFDHPKPVRAVLIEALSTGHFGGTGKLVDWDLAARLAETYPVILAGGLTPDNVIHAIGTVRPNGVDVSSGVETDGIKNPQRMREFVARARQGFQKM